MTANNKTDYITVVDGVCGGRPVLRGTRIEPMHLQVYALKGDIEGVIKDYPGLTEEQVLAAFDHLDGSPAG